jgi:ribosomal RNA-processing protein 12
MDEDTGKMIIDGDMDEDTEERATDVAGTAYRESITSVDGFTRGPNGRIKFNKDTKKRRRDEDANQDVEMADVDELASGNRSKKPKKKVDPKLGHEFKAKVR